MQNVGGGTKVLFWEKLSSAPFFWSYFLYWVQIFLNFDSIFLHRLAISIFLLYEILQDFKILAFFTRFGWEELFCNNSDCAVPIWTKIGTPKQLDTKNKPVMYFLKILKSDLTQRGQKSKFGLFWPNFNPMQTIFEITLNGTVQFWHNLAQWRTLNLGTVPWEQARSTVFFKFSNLTSHREVKVQNLTYFWPEITFWLVVRIRLVWCEQKLAQWSNLTLGTSL